ncbi:unnamed protein product [Blepharisma stoltei]|uniref:Uncharacterized protein n=1 Tax=Blepharisma stoltei TaxID=1481888 RepID=A0AAU9JNH9_9CILI|nr:unnamed protein product [Blepharisma stoltei]
MGACNFIAINKKNPQALQHKKEYKQVKITILLNNQTLFKQKTKIYKKKAQNAPKLHIQDSSLYKSRATIRLMCKQNTRDIEFDKVYSTKSSVSSVLI